MEYFVEYSQSHITLLWIWTMFSDVMPSFNECQWIIDTNYMFFCFFFLSHVTPGNIGSTSYRKDVQGLNCMLLGRYLHIFHCGVLWILGIWKRCCREPHHQSSTRYSKLARLSSQHAHPCTTLCRCLGEWPQHQTFCWMFLSMSKSCMFLKTYAYKNIQVSRMYANM